MNLVKQYGHFVPALYAAGVFVQSLFFKFKNAPETRYIFETKLDPWAASLGFPGVFSPGGIFSAHVIGSVELVASLLILAGTFMTQHRLLQGLGALLGIGIISGAIFFHLVPLGIEVLDGEGKGDGGLLFALACGVWIACLSLILIRRQELLRLVGVCA